ncbi:MAG TPA: DUF6666 family protein [Pirellulales bacterium]
MNMSSVIRSTEFAKLVLMGLLVLAAGHTLQAQTVADADGPDLRPAPTQTGDWRYEAPASAPSDQSEPRRHQTIDRSRPRSRAAQSVGPRVDRPARGAGNDGTYDERGEARGRRDQGYDRPGQRDQQFDRRDRTTDRRDANYVRPDGNNYGRDQAAARAEQEYRDGEGDSEVSPRAPLQPQYDSFGSQDNSRHTSAVRRIRQGPNQQDHQVDVHQHNSNQRGITPHNNTPYSNGPYQEANQAPPRRPYRDTDPRYARSRDNHVEPVGYQWRAAREDAQRAQLSEAPAYVPGAASDTADGAPTRPVSRTARALLPEHDYLEEGPSLPRTAARTRYTQTGTSRTFELPPGAELVQPQPDPMGGQAGGNIVYDDGRTSGPPGSYGAQGFSDDGAAPDGYDDGGYGGYGGGYDGYGRPMYSTPCPECGSCCGGISCPHRWFDESSVFAGVHAFKGGLDQGQNGNFGFQEGVNFAGSLWHQYGIGYQVGAQFVQSDLSGSNIASSFNNSRQQNFLTAGLFHRPACGNGLQGGVVFDWLDDRFYSHTRFTQMRGEISYITPYGNEFGFWGAFATGTNQTVQISSTTALTFGSVNMYNFFYRKNFTNGDQGRIWGGFTGDAGGIFGADYRVHMSNQWDLMGGFNYLIPGNGKSDGGSTQESWGLAMNVVWYPTRRACGIHNGPFRSLFGVADNNTFMVRER